MLTESARRPFYVFGRVPARAGVLLTVLWSALWLQSGCIRELSGEPVPEGAHLYYPTRLGLSVDQNIAYVVNTNFDQRFVTAWLTRVDVAALAAAGLAGDDNAAWQALSAGPRVPSLGGALWVDAKQHRAWLSHRGTGYLTALDIDSAATGDTWRCDGGAKAGMTPRAQKTSCDANHLFPLQWAVAGALGEQDEPSRDNYLDPFAVAQMAPNQLAVGFLGTGEVATVATATLPPQVTGVMSAPRHTRLFDLAAGPNGLLLAAGRRRAGMGMHASPESVVMTWPANAPPAQDTNPGAADLYAAFDRQQAQVQAFSPSAAMGGQMDGGGDGAGPEIIRLLPAPAAAGQATDRFFLLGRRPDTVSVARLRQHPESRLTDGAVTVVATAPTLEVVHTEALAGQALTDFVYLPRPQGNLLVVSSFVRDTLYFFADETDRLTLVHRLHLTAGRGPQALLPVQLGQKTYLLVTTFFDHGLDLIDVSSSGVSDFQLRARVQDATYPTTNRAR